MPLKRRKSRKALVKKTRRKPRKSKRTKRKTKRTKRTKSRRRTKRRRRKQRGGEGEDDDDDDNKKKEKKRPKRAPPPPPNEKKEVKVVEVTEEDLERMERENESNSSSLDGKCVVTKNSLGYTSSKNCPCPKEKLDRYDNDPCRKSREPRWHDWGGVKDDFGRWSGHYGDAPTQEMWLSDWLKSATEEEIKEWFENGMKNAKNFRGKLTYSPEQIENMKKLYEKVKPHYKKNMVYTYSTEDEKERISKRKARAAMDARILPSQRFRGEYGY